MFQFVQSFLCVLFLSLLKLGWSYEAFQFSHSPVQVAGGEAVYYQVDVWDTVLLVLFSDSGDADLYASFKNSQPSSDDYDFLSSSCGLDVMVIPKDRNTGSVKVYIMVLGHLRYENSTFRLYAIAPSAEDVQRYQVWEWDPESKTDKLVVDVDPLRIANDPELTDVLQMLGADVTVTGKVASSKKDGGNLFSTLAEYAGLVLVKFIEIAIEVLL